MNPKTKKQSITLLLIISVLFSACKKGEDDPVISLRTRKTRVVGEWRMTAGKASYTSRAYNESYTFDGSNVKLNVTSITPIVYTGKSTLSMTMNKDGSFTVSEVLGSSKLNAKGTWNFNSGVGEEKKKEDLIFELNEFSTGYTLGNNLFNRYSAHFTYQIKELRNKKMVINSSGKIYSNSSGDYATLSTEYTLEPQN